MSAIIKRFKQRRGTNAKRLLDTPLDGEVFYVKDYTTAGVSPIWVGDGSTAGAVDVFGNTFLKISDAATTATASKIAKRDVSGNLAGDILGNSATATKLATARSITLTGGVTGTVSFDGSANASIATTVASATTANITGLDTALAAKAPLASPALTGTPTVPTAAAATSTTQAASTAFTQAAIAAGNSATTTKLATARNIALTGDATGTVSFDGSANASIATTVSNATAAGKLSTARSITLTGAVSGTVSTDLSGNVSITTALGASVAGGVIYQGDYNAETNTPAIPVASTSNKGFSYRVSTARTTVTAAANVPTADLKIGDFLVSNGTSWDKWDNTDPTANEIFAQITEIDGGEL